MPEQLSGHVRSAPVAACDIRELVTTLRESEVNPQVEQNIERSGGSAIDTRTTSHPVT
jgi:hypothetical protein